MKSPDDLDALVKQATQYPPTPESKWKTLQNCCNLPSLCPDFWIRQPQHKWPKSWHNIEEPVVPLGRNLYGHPLAGLLWERQFEKVLLDNEREKAPTWECLFVHRQQGLFLSVYVDAPQRHQKWLGKKQHREPLWKRVMKHADLEKPTTILDQVYLGCTQRERKPNKNLVDENRKKFASRISAGATDKLPGSEKKWCTCYCVVLRYERTCEEMRGTVLRIRRNKSSSCARSPYHVLTTTRSRTVEELPKACFQNRPKVPLFGGHSQTRCSVVC